jgi:DNA-binding NarL/FixJ family response regulator
MGAPSRDTPISVLLVDDQELFVRNLQIVLESRMGDVRVTGIAHDGSEAIRLIAQEEPDIVLMDVRMPEMDGVEATRVIHKRYPSVRIVMLTTFDDDEYVYEALGHGAVGYLLKNIPPEELFSSIRAVHNGAVLISPSVAEKLVQNRRKRQAPQTEATQSPSDLLATLTQREREILRLIALAYTNRQIAERLMIAEQTVKNHTSIIYSKMGVTKRMELMRLLRDVSPDEL